MIGGGAARSDTAMPSILVMCVRGLHVRPQAFRDEGLVIVIRGLRMVCVAVGAIRQGQESAPGPDQTLGLNVPFRRFPRVERHEPQGEAEGKRALPVQLVECRASIGEDMAGVGGGKGVVRGWRGRGVGDPCTEQGGKGAGVGQPTCGHAQCPRMKGEEDPAGPLAIGEAYEGWFGGGCRGSRRREHGIGRCCGKGGPHPLGRSMPVTTRKIPPQVVVPFSLVGELQAPDPIGGKRQAQGRTLVSRSRRHDPFVGRQFRARALVGARPPLVHTAKVASWTAGNVVNKLVDFLAQLLEHFLDRPREWKVVQLDVQRC